MAVRYANRRMSNQYGGAGRPGRTGGRARRDEDEEQQPNFFQRLMNRVRENIANPDTRSLYTTYRPPGQASSRYSQVSYRGGQQAQQQQQRPERQPGRRFQQGALGSPYYRPLAGDERRFEQGALGQQYGYTPARPEPPPPAPWTPQQWQTYYDRLLGNAPYNPLVPRQQAQPQYQPGGGYGGYGGFGGGGGRPLSFGGGGGRAPQPQFRGRAPFAPNVPRWMQLMANWQIG